MASLPEYICCHTLTPDWLPSALKNSTMAQSMCCDYLAVLKSRVLRLCPKHVPDISAAARVLGLIATLWGNKTCKAMRMVGSCISRKTAAGVSGERSPETKVRSLEWRVQVTFVSTELWHWTNKTQQEVQSNQGLWEVEFQGKERALWTFKEMHSILWTNSNFLFGWEQKSKKTQSYRSGCLNVECRFSLLFTIGIVTLNQTKTSKRVVSCIFRPRVSEVKDPQSLRSEFLKHWLASALASTRNLPFATTCHWKLASGLVSTRNYLWILITWYGFVSTFFIWHKGSHSLEPCYFLDVLCGSDKLWCWKNMKICLQRREKLKR